MLVLFLYLWTCVDIWPSKVPFFVVLLSQICFRYLCPWFCHDLCGHVVKFLEYPIEILITVTSNTKIHWRKGYSYIAESSQHRVLHPSICLYMIVSNFPVCLWLGFGLGSPRSNLWAKGSRVKFAGRYKKFREEWSKGGRQPMKGCFLKPASQWWWEPNPAGKLENGAMFVPSIYPS